MPSFDHVTGRAEDQEKEVMFVRCPSGRVGQAMWEDYQAYTLARYLGYHAEMHD